MCLAMVCRQNAKVTSPPQKVFWGWKGGGVEGVGWAVSRGVVAASPGQSRRDACL